MGFVVHATHRRCILKDLANLALDTARVRGATYADVRIVQHREQTVNVKNGVVEGHEAFLKANDKKLFAQWR